MNGLDMAMDGQLVEWLSCGTWKHGVRFIPESVIQTEREGCKGMRYMGVILDAKKHRLMDRYSMPGRKSKVVLPSPSNSKCGALMGRNQVSLCHAELTKVVYPCWTDFCNTLTIHARVKTPNGEIQVKSNTGISYGYSCHPLVRKLIYALDRDRPEWRPEGSRWTPLNRYLDQVLESQERADRIVDAYTARGLLTPFEFDAEGHACSDLLFYRATAKKVKLFTLREWEDGVDVSGWGEDGLTLDELRSRLYPAPRELNPVGVVIWRVSLSGQTPPDRDTRWKHTKI